jgi:hypothetical protein
MTEQDKQKLINEIAVLLIANQLGRVSPHETATEVLWTIEQTCTLKPKQPDPQ